MTAKVLNQVFKLIESAKPDLVAITGPTSAGKTGLAFNLADRFDYDLISVDSRQVYQGMDIVTGKDVPDTFKFYQRGINSWYQSPLGWRIWGLSCLTPDQVFSLGKFLRALADWYELIKNRHRNLILVGGTVHWFYRLLTFRLTEVFVPWDQNWRQEAQNLSLTDIQARLKTKFPDKAGLINASDWANRRRLIRLYERFNYQIRPSQLELIQKLKSILNQPRLVLVLTPNREYLADRIKTRIRDRISQGAIEETRNLMQKYSPDIIGFNSPGYQQIIEYLSGRIGYDSMVRAWFEAEMKLVKKQNLWLNKLKREVEGVLLIGTQNPG